jgi:hypothetical protein
MMDLLKIGSHAINLDRVADICNQGHNKVVVIFGDYRLELEGDEAAMLMAFVDEKATRWERRSGPPKHTADLAGLESSSD